MPAPDPALRHGPVTLPEDPSGIAEPHDVLAAEEFAMPAGNGGSRGAVARAAESPGWSKAAAAAAAVMALVKLRPPTPRSRRRC